MSLNSIEKLRFSLTGATAPEDVFNWLGDLSIQYGKLVNSYAKDLVPPNVAAKQAAYAAAVADLKAAVAGYVNEN